MFLLFSKRFPEPERASRDKPPPVVRPDPRERARRWSAMIDGETIKTRADLAKHLGVSKARVTQVLGRIEDG